MKWATTLAVATAAVCLASVQAACPTGFVEFTNDGSPVCLIFVKSKATWSNMRDICDAMSASLAKLDGDLHMQVIQYINDQPAGDLDTDAFWLGGSDAAKEGSWVWLDGTEIPLGTPHWYPCNGQPNGGTQQNYLALYTPDYYFHSLEESRQIMGICRI
ncbi:ladderlectin-like isoform X3 [Eriocheir sinensis]|nr:ladderlectin-like isoform X3 [Eriocheir sinensis]